MAEFINENLPYTLCMVEFINENLLCTLCMAKFINENLHCTYCMLKFINENLLLHSLHGTITEYGLQRTDNRMRNLY